MTTATKMDALSEPEVPRHAAMWMRENPFSTEAVQGLRLAKGITAARERIEKDYALIDSNARELQALAKKIEDGEV